MNAFEAVRSAITARQAAEQYGIAVGRGGMAVCPFHNDKNPSMKVDRRFHCFGCGADGDVIRFTSMLFNIQPGEAARKLAQDFGLTYDEKEPVTKQYVRKKSPVQEQREAEQKAIGLLGDYLHLLKKWEQEYAPKSTDSEWSPFFIEAVQNKQDVEQAMDVFIGESSEVKAAWLASHKKELQKMEQRRNQFMSEKQTNKERLKEITDSIEVGISELFESEKYRRYLSVMSRFHRYSANNTMLIYLQNPEATLVAGYNKWKDQFERHVKKGERGITIIAPTPFKKKIEQQKLDPDTKAPMLDQNGQIITEETEVEIPMFRPIKVFDVSQTEGKPLPELASSLTGNVAHFEAFMEALKRSAPVPITMEPMASNTDGYFSPADQRIAIRTGMSEVQTISAAIHEIAHSKLHNYQKKPGEISQETKEQKSRNTQEVEAESVSYSVCQYYGIQTGENSFGYIAAWSKDKSLSELKASLETINKTAGELIADIDRHFGDICREQGIDLGAAEPESPKIPAQEPKTVTKYRVIPNPLSHNELDRSSIQEILVTGNQEVPGEILGSGRTKWCEVYTSQLNEGKVTAEEIREKLTEEASKWHCYIIPDLMTWNSAAMEEKNPDYIGRIDYLGTDGSVVESVQYTDAEELVSHLRKETYVGAPLSVILYKNKDGETISASFLSELDPPPKAVQIEDAPPMEHTARTPIEFYDTYEEAAARFRELRVQQYNYELTNNPQSNRPYARLTFGVQRENPPGAADLLHVRNGKNYLVDDYMRMEALNKSPDVQQVLQRMRQEIGFDRVILHTKDQSGKFLPPEDRSILETDLFTPPQNVLDMVNDFMDQGMTETQAEELADTEYRAAQAAEPEPSQSFPAELDCYPVPEPELYQNGMGSFTDAQLLPVSKGMAERLMDMDVTVYMVEDGNLPQMVFDQEELTTYSGPLAVSKEEWEQCPQFLNMVKDRLVYQQEREQCFLHYPGDCYAIYQVIPEDPQKTKFMSHDWLTKHSIPVNREDYNLVYTAPITGRIEGDAILENIYRTFNTDIPHDFCNPSVSVSDIIAIKQDGRISCHYCDNFGFAEISEFLPDNPLKNAEMILEDDYGMIDGIINNGTREPEQPVCEKRKSVLEQLKNVPCQESQKTQPKRTNEREI